MNRKNELLAQIAALQAEADALPSTPREIGGVWRSDGSWYGGWPGSTAKYICSKYPGFTYCLMREVMPLVVTDEVCVELSRGFLSRDVLAKRLRAIGIAAEAAP